MPCGRQPTTPDIETVVQSGLCAGCGLCESIAGHDAVEMRLTEQGRLRPRVKQQLAAKTNERIMKVCPGAVVNGPTDAQLVGSQGSMHPVFGPLRTWHFGWAADENIRWRAAAGGSLTALASFLLETGKVQRVLHVRASQVEPTLTDALVSSTPAEVADGCQSRYGPAAPLVHVCRLLDEGAIFAVVAKPCDISAIRALEREDPRVAHQIPYCLSIFCGGIPTSQAARKIVQHHGVAEDNLAGFRFRGHGWPGLTASVKKSDGSVVGSTYDEIWNWPGHNGLIKYDLQWRCKICPDAIGELADVTCPDGWLFDEKLGKYVSVDGDNPGRNLILARTAKGESLVSECAASGKLKLDDFDLRELDIMHSDHLPRKLSWPARVGAMRLTRQPAVLKVYGYRLPAALRAAGLRNSWKAFAGAMRRLCEGANIEPLA